MTVIFNQNIIEFDCETIGEAISLYFQSTKLNIDGDYCDLDELVCQQIENTWRKYE